MRIVIWRVTLPQSAPPETPTSDWLDTARGGLGDDATHPSEPPAAWQKAMAPLAVWVERLKEWAER